MEKTLFEFSRVSHATPGLYTPHTDEDWNDAGGTVFIHHARRDDVVASNSRERTNDEWEPTSDGGDCASVCELGFGDGGGEKGGTRGEDRGVEGGE